MFSDIIPEHRFLTKGMADSIAQVASPTADTALDTACVRTKKDMVTHAMCAMHHANHNLEEARNWFTRLGGDKETLAHIARLKADIAKLLSSVAAKLDPTKG